MLDISSFKLWWVGSGKFPYVKKELHTALSDINESIAEFQFYLKDIEQKYKNIYHNLYTMALRKQLLIPAWHYNKSLTAINVI